MRADNKELTNTKNYSFLCVLFRVCEFLIQNKQVKVVP